METRSDPCGDRVALCDGAYWTQSTTNGPVWINRYSTVLRSEVGGYLTVGLFSFVSDAVVGRYVSIGSRVSVGAFSHPLDSFTTNEIGHRDTRKFFSETLFVDGETPVSAREETSIESDVYVGDNAVVLSGVTLGVGCVVGAGSVVTKDVSPYSVVVGNPARHIKYRFGVAARNSLLKSRWWEYSVSELKKNGLLYTLNKITGRNGENDLG